MNALTGHSFITLSVFLSSLQSIFFFFSPKKDLNKPKYTIIQFCHAVFTWLTEANTRLCNNNVEDFMKQVILLHIVHILNSFLFFFNIYDTLNLWFEIWKIFCCLGILNKLKMLLNSDNDLISLSFFSLCCRQEKAELALNLTVSLTQIKQHEPIIFT